VRRYDLMRAALATRGQHIYEAPIHAAHLAAMWHHWGHGADAGVKTKPVKAKPGPKPAVLKLEGNWIDNIAKSFEKKKPAAGWPK
jgi:hypothetical protein